MEHHSYVLLSVAPPSSQSCELVVSACSETIVHPETRQFTYKGAPGFEDD